MDVDVNWLAVVLATVSSMIVGSVWYMPKVFGNTWMKLAKIDQKEMAKRSSVKPILLTIVVSFFTAYILAHVTVLAHAYFDNSFLSDAIQTAFWLWLGLTAARFITHDAFEGRPTQLTLLNVFHELVTVLVMALIIGLFGPTA